MVLVQVQAVDRAIGELRTRVGEARTTFGDTPAMRRLLNDVERLEIDVRDLDAAQPAARVHVPSQPMVQIPDTPADPSLWVDADDEGIGGYHGPLR